MIDSLEATFPAIERCEAVPFSFRGPLKAVVFDWAGTMVDFGSRAPIMALLMAFEREGVPVSEELARRFMGIEKRDHIWAMMQTPEVRAAWKARHGHEPDTATLDAFFERFIPFQLEVLPQFTALVPGLVETGVALRARGLRFGTCTGYNKEMTALLAAAAREQGWAPDEVICAHDVPAGRPAPWMMHLNAVRLGVYPMAAIVKVGDAEVDMVEARNAGSWAVGIVEAGNEVGLSPEQLAALSPDERLARFHEAARRLRAAGAHYIVRSVTSLPEVVDAINERLASGEMP